MHNKKLKGGIAVLALSAVLVGGTFAWLGSSDKVQNIFKTPSPKQEGVDIYEKFEQESEATPGTAVTKIVQVKNEAQYNSLIRVEMNKAFVPKEAQNNIELDNSKINLNKANVITENQITFNEDGSVKDGLNKWVEVNQSVTTEDGETVTKTYYYYIGNVAPNGFTDKILDSVTLDSSVAADPNYLNQTFNVDINAYSIQSTAEAVTDTTDGKDKYGATGDQKGFGLNASQHANLVKALQAVARGTAGTVDQITGTVATPNSATE